jgi:hypothetical protein
VALTPSTALLHAGAEQIGVCADDPPESGPDVVLLCLKCEKVSIRMNVYTPRVTSFDGSCRRGCPGPLAKLRDLFTRRSPDDRMFEESAVLVFPHMSVHLSHPGRTSDSSVPDPWRHCHDTLGHSCIHGAIKHFLIRL